jgi:hypothetical protein
MYWTYLIIFTLVIFVPTIFQHGFYALNTAQTQEFAILILGSLGFLIFLIQEKKLRKNLFEKNNIQRKVNRMTKDLTHSYSYIGEINRKLDLLENITLSYPESLNLTAKKQKELYNSTIEAIRLLGKSDEFSLRFVRVENNEILKEIKSSSDLSLNFSLKNLDSTAQFFESDDFIVANSPRTIDNVFACVVIRKKTPSQKIEDLEMIRMLAAQALFLYMFVHDKKQIEALCADVRPMKKSAAVTKPGRVASSGKSRYNA